MSSSDDEESYYSEKQMLRSDSFFIYILNTIMLFNITKVKNSLTQLNVMKIVLYFKK